MKMSLVADSGELTLVPLKRGSSMKIATSFLAAMLFTSMLGTVNNAIAADNDTEKVPLAPDGYCHKKFPAIGDSPTAPCLRVRSTARYPISTRTFRSNSEPCNTGISQPKA